MLFFPLFLYNFIFFQSTKQTKILLTVFSSNFCVLHKVDEQVVWSKLKLVLYLEIKVLEVDFMGNWKVDNIKRVDGEALIEDRWITKLFLLELCYSPYLYTKVSSIILSSECYSIR